MDTPRIVSLIASSTEIIHALGFGDYMVGRSHECDFPDSVSELPVCTGPKFKTDGTSYEIDQRVKAIVQEGLSVYRVDASTVESLMPTHIVTQDQCQVCAVSLKDVEDAACELIGSRPRIVSLKPDCLEDVWNDIRLVARAFDAESKGESLIRDLKKRIKEIESASTQAAGRAGRRPRVVCIEWIDPIMSAGNWMPELVELAGGTNLFGLAGQHSPWMEWSQLVEAAPDIIIVTPCGFDNKRTLSEMHLLSDRSDYNLLPAVKSNRVVVADGNQYFNRPGPRLVESLEMMAEIFYPDSFDFGHQGTGWLRYRSGDRPHA